MKKNLLALWIIFSAVLLLLPAACAGVSFPPTPMPILPPATDTPVPPPAPASPAPPTGTAAPGLVPVTIGVSSGSPYLAYFVVYNSAEEPVYQSPGIAVRSDTIYLPPGDYRWTANAPIPTQPLGCFTIPESYGFSKDGRFTAVKEAVQIEIKIGFRLVMCTTTPHGT